jgi:hypothetical protein
MGRGLLVLRRLAIFYPIFGACHRRTRWYSSCKGLVHQQSELFALDFSALQKLLWLEANKDERKALIFLNFGDDSARR